MTFPPGQPVWQWADVVALSTAWSATIDELRSRALCSSRGRGSRTTGTDLLGLTWREIEAKIAARDERRAQVEGTKARAVQALMLIESAAEKSGRTQDSVFRRLAARSDLLDGFESPMDLRRAARRRLGSTAKDYAPLRELRRGVVAASKRFFYTEADAELVWLVVQSGTYEIPAASRPPAGSQTLVGATVASGIGGYLNGIVFYGDSETSFRRERERHGPGALDSSAFTVALKRSEIF